MSQVHSTSSSCPPAAPPLPSFQKTINNSGELAKHTDFSGKAEQFCSEQSEKDHIIKLWTLLNPNSSISSCLFYYSHLRPIVQEGPTCGLVALAMLCTITDTSMNLNGIIHQAKQAGYSKKGEMFSSYHMTSLSQSFVSDYFTITHYSTGMHGNKESILACLREGGFILVPYDADKNHSPAMLCGHKAHWAVLCGIVHDSEKVFVIARQGKSRYPALWDFKILADSNSNLIEVSQDRICEDYITHDIKTTLAGHFVQFDKIQPQI